MEDELIICDKVHFGKIVVVFSFPNNFFFFPFLTDVLRIDLPDFEMMLFLSECHSLGFKRECDT